MDKVSLLADVLGIPEWYSDAACNTVVHPELDADEWFPERGSSTKKAKEICNKCPVIEPCLEQALERGERFGIWGGKSEIKPSEISPNIYQQWKMDYAALK